jgi:hypothetical protein
MAKKMPSSKRLMDVAEVYATSHTFESDAAPTNLVPRLSVISRDQWARK